MGTSREALVAMLLILALWAIAASAWPLTGMVVPWDSKNQFYPTLRYLGEALQNGEIPFWNPYHFSGHPSVADPQSLIFTPTMMLFAWLVPEPSMKLFDGVVFAHFLPGALAFVPLFRRRGWKASGAVVAAAIFMLGGSATARLQHTGMILGYGFFPLALLFLEEALDRKSYFFGVLFPIAAAFMTIGRDQVAFLCAFTLIGACLHRIWTADAPLAYLRSRLGIIGLMLLVGGGLLAVPVILTMQFLMTSTRPSFGFGVAAMGSLPPGSLVTILFGNVFGSLRHSYDYWGPDWHSVPEGTWTDRATNYLFAGTVPALLLFWHGIAGGRVLAREFRFFLVLGIAALVYALGRYSPGFAVVFDYLPGVDLYRRPADATFLINIVLAFTGGYLVHRYAVDGLPRWRMPGPLRARLASFAMPCLALALVTAALLCALRFAMRAAEVTPAMSEIGIGLLASGLIMMLMTWASSSSRRGYVTLALVLLTGSELVGRHAASALNAEPEERYAVFEQVPPEQLKGLAILKTELSRRHAEGDYPRVEILGLSGPWQNASMVFGIEDIIGYNPLRLADYERAVGPGENAEDVSLRQFPATFRGYKCRLAGMLGLEYLVLDRPMEQLPRHFPRLAGAEVLYGVGKMWIYRLNGVSPRVYVASKVDWVDSEAALDQQELPEFDRMSEALVDAVDRPLLKFDYALASLPVAESDSGQARKSAWITRYARTAIDIDVDSDHDGVLVLHDIYYPGWEVTVDGARRPILRANLLFRGVEVEKGRHHVTFRFRPTSLENLVAAATEVVKNEIAPVTTAEALVR